MRYSQQIKPLSSLRSSSLETLNKLIESRKPTIFTQNGEAKAVLQDIVTYEQTQETLALLKILALGQQQWEANALTAIDEVVTQLTDKGKKAYGGV